MLYGPKLYATPEDARERRNPIPEDRPLFEGQTVYLHLPGGDETFPMEIRFDNYHQAYGDTPELIIPLFKPDGFWRVTGSWISKKAIVKLKLYRDDEAKEA